MRNPTNPDETRRRMLGAMITTPIVLAAPGWLAALGCSRVPAPTASLAPTPACTDDDDADPTESQTEGPYFTPNSPLRTVLRQAGMSGAPLVIAGSVLTRSCRPVEGALLDFWQADDAGDYDNVGYTLRGHQFSDANGGFRLETIVPGLYPGRTRHIHVKVQAPNQPTLTTQLYFPGESRNTSDGIYDADLLLEIADGDSGREGRFAFVLDLP